MHPGTQVNELISGNPLFSSSLYVGLIHRGGFQTVKIFSLSLEKALMRVLAIFVESIQLWLHLAYF
jgi:hypothetical protein